MKLLKSTSIVFIICFFIANAYTSKSFAQEDRVGNPELSALIDSLAEEDQQWRQRLMDKQNGKADSLSETHIRSAITKMSKRHYPIIIKIFLDFGYPSNTLVGKTSAHNYWLLVQHQDHQIQFQEKILIAMKGLLESGQISLSDYAYLVDRVNINKGLKQVYGTQMELNEDGSSFTYKPVEEPDSLDAYRKKMGLPPMDFYINSMNETYRGNLTK